GAGRLGVVPGSNGLVVAVLEGAERVGHPVAEEDLDRAVRRRRRRIRDRREGGAQVPGWGWLAGASAGLARSGLAAGAAAPPSPSSDLSWARRAWAWVFWAACSTSSIRPSTDWPCSSDMPLAWAWRASILSRISLK